MTNGNDLTIVKVVGMMKNGLMWPLETTVHTKASDLLPGQVIELAGNYLRCYEDGRRGLRLYNETTTFMLALQQKAEQDSKGDIK